MADAQHQIESVIAEKVAEVARDPAVPGLQSTAAPPVANALNDKLGPWILSMTNNEPWYQSKVIWGLIIGGVGTIVRPIAGEILPTEQATQWAESLSTLGAFVGIGFALYARIRAVKNIPTP